MTTATASDRIGTTWRTRAKKGIAALALAAFGLLGAAAVGGTAAPADDHEAAKKVKVEVDQGKGSKGGGFTIQGATWS